MPTTSSAHPASGREALRGYRFSTSSQAMPVYSKYSFVRDSTYVPVPAQLHQYHHQARKCTTVPYICRDSPIPVLSPGSITADAGTPGLFDVRSPSNSRTETTTTSHPSTATTSTKTTCMRLRTCISTLRQPIAHKFQLSRCSLLNMFPTRIYLVIITLMCEPRRKRRAVVPLGLTLYHLDDCIRLCAFVM